MASIGSELAVKVRIKGQPANSVPEDGTYGMERMIDFYALELTMAKAAPCGSRHWTIQDPPGTCMGPLRI